LVKEVWRLLSKGREVPGQYLPHGKRIENPNLLILMQKNSICQEIVDIPIALMSHATRQVFFNDQADQCSLNEQWPVQGESGVRM